MAMLTNPIENLLIRPKPFSNQAVRIKPLVKLRFGNTAGPEEDKFLAHLSRKCSPSAIHIHGSPDLD